MRSSFSAASALRTIFNAQAAEIFAETAQTNHLIRVQDLLEVARPLSAHFSLQFRGYIIINCYGSSHVVMW
jgi:hypothetical protein